MWNWFNCFISGRHEYGVWCEPGAIFLRCAHCGKRSSGWAMEPKLPVTTPRAAVAGTPAASISRVIPFQRAAAS